MSIHYTKNRKISQALFFTTTINSCPPAKTPGPESIISSSENNPSLQKRDFINPRINWEEKGKNINQIIHQLTLRASDCIFIDDNPIELEKVKSQIKKIKC